jgi:hypothetical protein
MATLLLSRVADWKNAMKSLLLTGGILGFACGFAFSFLHKEPWLTCLERGGLSAFFTSLLLVWWDRAWNDKINDAPSNRQNASDTLLSTSTHPKTSRS